MSTPVTCHMLIGPQGSGKSTLAEAWIQRDPTYVVISTDALRAELYGDEAHQGSWAEIEAQVVARIKAAVAQGQSVIYDATNARRGWRIGLLQQFVDCNCQWVGWWLKHITLEECKVRNQTRHRRVPEAVLERTYQALKEHPPIEAEGFEAVWEMPIVGGHTDWEKLDHTLANLAKSLQQRRNRYSKIRLHPYSSLLDFERLLYLIATLIQYPGVGTWHQQHPEKLQNLGMNAIETIADEVDEIQWVIAHNHGPIYANSEAIRRDLDWLTQNGMVNSPYSSDSFDLPEQAGPVFLTAYHTYGDRKTFDRLMTTVRFIAHHPSIYTQSQRSLEALVQAMDRQDIFSKLDARYDCQDINEHQEDRQRRFKSLIRKDIQNIFKPYKIMSPQPASKGYFLGTAIFSKEELLDLLEILQGNTQHMKDPIAVRSYETFHNRIQSVKIDTTASYPVRTILHRPIVDSQTMAPFSTSLILPGNIDEIEKAIRERKTVTIQRIRGTGRFQGEDDNPFQVLPLQIGFYDLGWYLGYKQVDNCLLRFERLDRLQLIPTGLAQNIPREYSVAEQDQARQEIAMLTKASYGVYLGNCPDEQKSFLSKSKNRKKEVEMTLELWLTANVFRFMSEGTQRFPGRVKMSPRLPGATTSETERKKIFTLTGTGDQTFPHRFRACLPIWVLRDDVQFRRWVLGFAGEVKVIEPDDFAQKIAEYGAAIAKNYADRKNL